VAVYLAGAIFTADRNQLAKGLVVWALWFAVFLPTVAIYLTCGRVRFRTGLGAGFLALGAYLCAGYVPSPAKAFADVAKY
jgi:hypothetical protein